MADARKIYVVTCGEYSSYGISAVFDSRELAEAMTSGSSEYEIEEYTLNPGESHYREGRQRFEVQMFDDGDVFKVTALGWAWDDEREDRISPLIAGTGIDRNLAYFDPVLTANVWARDQDHAIKIVNERRAQHLASGEWQRATHNYDYRGFAKLGGKPSVR